MSVIRRSTGLNTHSATIEFYCPGCQTMHGVNSSFEFNGDCEKPTIRPAVRHEGTDEHGATTCHAFITRGRIEFMGDCSHKLRNQTVAMQEF
jgi:hypothetical protein